MKMGACAKKNEHRKLEDAGGGAGSSAVTAENRPAELGGWRWMIVFSSFLMYFLVHCALRALPVLFVELVDFFKAGEAETAWIPALQEFMFKGSGVIIAPLIKKYGCRKIAMTGTFLASLGYAIGTFCQNVPQLIVSVGVLAGFGMGMMILSALICVQYHFEEGDRSMASSFAIVGNSVGTLAGAPFTRWMMKLYSWRGALFVQAGVMLNGIIASTLLRPKPEKTPTHAHQNESEVGLLSDMEEHACEENGHAVNVDIRARNRANHSLCSQAKLGLCNSAMKFFGSDLMHNPAFVIYVLSNIFVFFGYIVPISYLPERAVKHLGVGKLDASFLISIIALANISSRIGVGFIRDATARFWVYFVISLFSGMVSCFTPFFTNYRSLAFYSALFGVCHGSFLPLKVVIVVDIAGSDHVENAVAWSFACVSIPVLIGPPLAGEIIERTHSYDRPFVVAGMVQIFGALWLLMIPLFFREKRRYSKRP